MSKGQMRFGLLGCAHAHGALWVDAVGADPHATVQGIWDHDPMRGTEFAENRALRFYDDANDLLRECDAVGITSETVRHPEMVEIAARAGVPVVCEKPLAIDLPGCRRMAAAVQASGIMFLANMPKRFDPVNHELQRLLHDGTLGDISLVRVRHGHNHGGNPRFAHSWIADSEQGGGGALLDEGIHVFDFLRWLFGDPISVTATTSRASLNLQVEDTATVTLEFADGMLADVSTSWGFVAGEASVEMFGTEGTALLSGVDLASRDMSGPYLKTYTQADSGRRWTESDLVPGFVTGAFHGQGPLHLLECVRTGTMPQVSLADGMAALAITQTAYESARTGRTLRYVPPHGDAASPRKSADHR